MKLVFDTNSLLSLVRYYLPFDKNRVLFEFIKQRIESGEIILIDKVLEECTYISKGIVIKTLDYLQDPKFLRSAKIPFKTDSLIAPSPAKFLRQVDNQFANLALIKQMKLTETEYENRKNAYLNSADAKQIILCLNFIRNNEDVILVTEETESSNDHKEFKKIPSICSQLNIKTFTLPEILTNYEFDLDFKQNGVSGRDFQPICKRCKHFFPILNSCNAFPEGIPAIILNTNNHDKPIEGQKNNIVFTPLKK